MPSYLDLGLLAVVLISAFLSMVRGFTREVLAIISWGAAAAAALYLYPLVLTYVPHDVAAATYAIGSLKLKDSYAAIAAAVVVFLVTLVVVSILTVKISDAILDSKVGALDRSLGFLFGAARGFLLCVVAFLLFVWLMPDAKSMPEWAANARSRPFLEAAGDQVRNALPAGAAEAVFKFVKKSKGGTTDEPPAETDPEAKPVAPPAPAPTSNPPAKKTELAPPANPVKTPVPALDKQKLNALAAGAAGKP